MRKVLYITILATIVLLSLQGVWTCNMYKDYAEKQRSEMASLFSTCLQKELALRRVGKYKDADHPRVVHKMASDMSPEERERHKGDTLDLCTLHRAGVGNSLEEAISQIMQDGLMNKGKSLNLSVLDSIFKEYLLHYSIKARYYIATYNSDTAIIASVGDLSIENGKAAKQTLIPIGTKGNLFVQMRAEIPLSEFFRQQYLMLGLSAMLILIVVICVFCQLVIIRRKNDLVKGQETCVNGTIHDLKAPLGNALMLMQYVKPKMEDVSIQNLMEQATVQLEHLKRDVESLLLTASWDRKQLFLEKKRCKLSDIAEEARQIILSESIGKSFQLEIEALPDEEFVEVDPMYMRNVILNLIHNAIKYSGESVRIIIEVTKEGKMAVLKVHDNGWGIDKKYQKKIFNQFYQISVPNGKRKNGYGIGLAYAWYILKQHKGTIAVESKLGIGSTFVSRIPIKK